MRRIRWRAWPCETATSTNLVVVLGEITTTANVDYEAIVRDTVKRIGYDDPDIGIDYKTCEVLIRLHEQSPDISQGVSTALEQRGEGNSRDEVEDLGAGDQGMMVGFACNETEELMAADHRASAQAHPAPLDCPEGGHRSVPQT